MIELEIMLNDLKKMLGKEKSIRKRILLEEAITALDRYERLVLSEKEATLTGSRKK